MRNILNILKKFIRRLLVACRLHKAWYRWLELKGRRFCRQNPSAYDFVWVANEDHKDWILDGIARDVGRHMRLSQVLARYPAPLPPARTYFVLMHNYLPAYVRSNPWLLTRRTIVYFTHREKAGVAWRELVDLFNRIEYVVCMNSRDRDCLVAAGVKEQKVRTIIGGADPAVFKPHTRGGGAVGFCSSYYARKNPATVEAIVRAMPGTKFILLGRNWERYGNWNRMKNLVNLEYVVVPYRQYPEWYEKMDVFVSPSLLEGGPIPLLEAMFCNAVPVASRTGFAPDVIRHGVNGYLHDIGAPADEICRQIKTALNFNGDIRSSVLKYSWDSFARELVNLTVSPERCPGL